MKFFKLISIVLLLQACSEQSTDTPQIAENGHHTYTAEEFYKTTSVSGSSISHDGTAVLVSSDATGIYNAYRQPLDGSATTALTASTVDSTFAVSWFPADDRIIYFADEGGNENDHVYVRELDGSTKDLTPGENVKAQFASWHEDDQQFYIVTNERDPRYFDLYKYQISDYSRELVFENNDGYSPGALSPNGKWLTLGLEHSNTNSDLYAVDLTSGDNTAMLVTSRLQYYSGQHQAYICHQ